MNRAARLAERGATFLFLVVFAGIMWPPNTYFAGEMLTPQGASNIWTSWNSPCCCRSWRSASFATGATCRACDLGLAGARAGGFRVPQRLLVGRTLALWFAAPAR